MRWLALILLAILTPPLTAQIDAPAAMQALLRDASAQESSFARALGEYTWRQDFAFTELSNQQHQRGGTYRVVTDITITPDGRRIEQIVRGPDDHLHFLRMSKEDFSDLRAVVPLLLTRNILWEYSFRDLGPETIELRDGTGREAGSLTAEAFSMAPRQTYSNQRYFEGKIWIDPATRGIVKISGRPVPDLYQKRNGQEEENLFGHFTTWRQRIDGHFWFPVYTEGEDWLGFSSGAIEVSEHITWTRYRRFSVSTRVMGAHTQP